MDRLPSGVPDDKLWFLGVSPVPCGAPGTVLSKMQRAPSPTPPKECSWKVSVDNGENTPIKGVDLRMCVDSAGPVWGFSPCVLSAAPLPWSGVGQGSQDPPGWGHVQWWGAPGCGQDTGL